MQANNTTTTQKTDLYKVAELQVSYKGRNRNLPKICSAADARVILRQIWSEDRIELQEEFKVLLLSNSLQIKGVYNVGVGGIVSTIADIRLILAAALKTASPKIIIAHNHPSGILMPSEADKKLTQQLKNAAEYMDIMLLDHVIITAESYFSFADEGLL